MGINQKTVYFFINGSAFHSISDEQSKLKSLCFGEIAWIHGSILSRLHTNFKNKLIRMDWFFDHSARFGGHKGWERTVCCHHRTCLD